MNMKTPLIALAALMLTGFTYIGYAGDSPQFRGPNRDGKFDEKGLLKAWPENGPPVAWVAKGMGKGYSSVAVAQGKIYLTGMFEDQNACLLELNADGSVARKIPYGKETLCKEAPGPRSTPTLDGDRLYLMSSLGVLYCIDLAQGQKKWEVNIFERFGAENAMWHLAESVLIDGDRVLCTPGGKNGLVAALDKMTGETLWATKGLEDRASYCSPIIVTHQGRRILLDETAKYIFGVDPEAGGLLWSFQQKVPWDIHANTPVFMDGLVYYTAGDGRGGGALAISQDGASVTSKWTANALDSLHYGVVLVDGYLYGCGSKGGGPLVCIEMATGKVMWAAKEIAEGATVCADGMLYIYEGPKKGVFDLVKAAPTGFERTGRFNVTEGDGNHWTHPVVANGRLYIRRGDALMAYDVAGK